MEAGADSALIALLGSETRLRVLAVLANASRPMTAYRIGKTGGVPMPKAYGEVRRLGRAGLLRRVASGWVLDDRDVRILLQKRVRVYWYEDFRAERERTAPARRALLRRLQATPPPRFPRNWRPRDPASQRRDPHKDELLREMGRQPSVHG